MDHDELQTLPRSERIKELFDVETVPDYQADLLDHHEQQDKTQAAPKKGRQVGATFIAALIAADYALTHSNETTFITAPNQDPAENLFREFKRHFRRSEYTIQIVPFG